MTTQPGLTASRQVAAAMAEAALAWLTCLDPSRYFGLDVLTLHHRTHH